MKNLFLFFLITFTSQSMILKTSKGKIIPESNKLVLSLTPDLQFETKNKIKSAHSSNGLITVHDEPENKKHFEKIIKASTTPLFDDEKNFTKSQKHIEIIEIDLKHALNQSKGSPIVINPHVLKTISAYLKNLEYSKKMNFEKEVPDLPYTLKHKLPVEKKKREGEYDAEGKYWELEAKIKDAKKNNEKEEKIKNLENQLRDVKKDKEVIKELEVMRNEKLGIKTKIDSNGEILSQEENVYLDSKSEEEEVDNAEENQVKKENSEHSENSENAEIPKMTENKEITKAIEDKQTNEETEEDLEHKEKIYADIVIIDERIIELTKEIEETSNEDKKASLTEEKASLTQERKQLEKANEDTTITSIKSSIMMSDENNYTGFARNYENIPNLLIIIQSISAAYNTLFNEIPENADKVPKSSLEQLKEGLLLYAKLRNFIVAITVNRDKVKEDLIYVKNNIDSIELNHDEVLGFFDLNDRYVELLYRSNKLDTKFWEKVTELKLETDSFSASITKIAKNVNTLITLEDLIFDKTDYLRNNMDNDETMDSIKKVDATLLLLPELIEIKDNLDEVFKELNDDFEVVKGKREGLILLLDDMDRLNKGEVMEDKGEEEYVGIFVSRFGLIWFFLFLVNLS